LNLFHRNQNGVPRRHELERILALAFGLRIELGRDEHLLAPGLHHPAARHESAADGGRDAVHREVRGQHAARLRGGRVAAHGVEQRGDHAGVEEAGVLAHVFLAPVHAQLGLAVGGVVDFEAGPAVEGSGPVDGLDGVEHGGSPWNGHAWAMRTNHSTNRRLRASSRA